VIRAGLDHYIERNCRSDWSRLPTLVSDESVRPHFGDDRELPRSPLGVIPEKLVRELSHAEAGQLLELPDPVFFPFRAITAWELRDYESYSEYSGRHHLDWEKFSRRGVRGGIIHFSAAVFNEAGDAAVIYRTHSCGSLCADGSLLYLRKKPFGWVVVRELPLWIS
jgi:hypothetical protein